MEKELRFYRTRMGRKPFIKWLSALKDKTLRAKIKNRIRRMSLGYYGDYKSLNRDIYEMRLYGSAGYRIYFAELNKVVILLLIGGNKNTQKKDIKKAKAYWLDFKERFGGN